MTDMYRLPPIIPATMEFQLPDRMYKLPLIQKSNVSTISNPSVEVTKCGRNDDQVLKELERRQEAILEKLASLKLQVSTLKGDKHVAITQDEIIEDKLEQLFKTIRKIEQLFAKYIAPNTFLQMRTAAKTAKDIVIRANPKYPPHVLPLLCSQLQQSLKVFTSAHLHSTVKCLPNSLEDYLPLTNCDSRSKADLCITLIWINVGKDVELVTAPTSSSIIKGESNVLRYMARRFGLFQSLEQSEIMAASLDELMDSLYFEKLWGSFSIAKLVNTTLEPMLKASPFLGGNHMSIADLYAFSLATNEKGKWPQAIKEWMERCQRDLLRKVPLKVDPKLRQRKPSSSRNFNLKKSSSPAESPKKLNSGIIEIGAGQTLLHQWPEIPSVYLAKEAMIEHLSQDHIALVSEKIDGSNLSVSSAGVVASRRKVILTNPSGADLEKTKFAGESLRSLKPILANLKSMLKSVFNPMLQSSQKLEIIVYGEWVQAGTASSKEDKFNYKERMLEPGQLYGFGLGIYFPHGPISQHDLHNFKYVLKKHRFAVKNTTVQDDLITVILNGELKRLFEKFDISVVPVLHTLPFTKIFSKFADELLQQKVEGYILTIPSRGQIFKWKGCEESDPRRVESFVDLASACKITEAIIPLNKVLQESLLYNTHGRKRYFDPTLVSAFNSARSKFPRLDDILQNINDQQARKKIIEGYKFTLADEITKDFGKVFGCTAESIEAFMKHEM